MKAISETGLTIFKYDHNFISGTEIMAMGFEKNILPYFPKFVEWNWILAPGKINLREDGKNIVWVHLGEFEGDLSWLNDSRVAYIVFVSHYQYHRFLERYNLDSRKCIVIQNAINPIEIKEKESDKIKIIFHSEPYRGLEILLKALKQINNKKIELHIFGDLDTNTVDFWKESIQDKIKKLCNEDTRIKLHGRVSHNTIEKFIGSCNMFVYPSTWRETSCLSLIEAMSAGLYCITNDLTVLPETGIGLTKIFNFTFDEEEHISRTKDMILSGIDDLKYFNPLIQSRLTNDKYSWDSVRNKWIMFGQKITNGDII